MPGSIDPSGFTKWAGQRFSSPGNPMAGIAADQAKQAAALQAQLLNQPKQISPDNFLAMKNKMLTSMRLGLASTMTAGAGTPSPVLSTPALLGANGKNKLGS